MAIKLQHFQMQIYTLWQKHAFGGYSINGQHLTSVNYHKDLGVTFDC